jgi:hypothetical protein
MASSEAPDWVGIFAGLTAKLGDLSEGIKKQNRLSGFQHEMNLRVQPVSQTVTGTVSVMNLGTPNDGYWWKLRSVRVVGPAASNGTVLAVANVNVDLYVSATPVNAGTPPPIGDWVGAAGTSTSPSGLPATLAPGEKEVVLQSGDSLVVVCSGAGVANIPIVAVAQVSQLQGFAELPTGTFS